MYDWKHSALPEEVLGWTLPLLTWKLQHRMWLWCMGRSIASEGSRLDSQGTHTFIAPLNLLDDTPELESRVTTGQVSITQILHHSNVAHFLVSYKVVCCLRRSAQQLLNMHFSVHWYHYGKTQKTAIIYTGKLCNNDNEIRKLNINNWVNS